MASLGSMPLGTQHRHAQIALALLLSAAVLVGCGGDEARAPSGSESSAGESTSETATTEPAEQQSTIEATPAVEPATGLKLKHDLAEITMPEGWRRAYSHGVPFLRQGRSPNAFGMVTFSELGGAATDPVATSLDAIAKRSLRLFDNPRMKRVDDAVIGGDTVAYRLVGMEDKTYYSEQYGVLQGDIEYVISFSFNTGSGTVEEAVAVIESIMATWDFNP